jgi:chromosome condensin MukBEF ATPase and DNA-binding subunit MukB
MRKKKAAGSVVNSMLAALRARREKVFSARDRTRKSRKGKLVKEEMQLWKSEKALLKSQKRMENLESKFKQAEREYQENLWQFIQASVKASQVKRMQKANRK